MTMPPGAQVSDDGNYWWDDATQAWQPMDAAAPTDDVRDWSEFPEIYALIYSQTTEEWLQSIGIDPKDLVSEEVGVS